MTSFTRLVDRHFGREGRELLIGGMPVGKIVQPHGTPLFVYDASVLEAQLASLRAALPAGFEIYYSVKANPNQAILRHFVGQGCGLEVASGGELFQALKAGCSPGRVVFAGPGKTEDELEYALARGIGELHVESMIEIERIAAICTRRQIRANIAIRINPGEEAQGGAMRMGGKPSPFGIDEEAVGTVVDRVLREPSLALQGVHLFIGTQILDHRLLVGQYRAGLELARTIATRGGRPLRTVDFGGGLGIPYFPHEAELDVEQLGAELRPVIAEARRRPEFAGTTFMIEPGRYLAGPAGIYVARVATIKESRGKKFLIVDGGMHHHLAASGNLGQVIKRNFPVALLNRLGEEPEEAVDVVGVLCTPLDVLAKDVRLPVAELGDLVGIGQSGAYARSASPLGFLSHPTPAEVLVADGQASLIRSRGTYEDLVRDMA